MVAEHASVKELLQEAVLRLAGKSSQSPKKEAECLLAHLIDKTPLELYLEPLDISESIQQEFFEKIKIRAKGFPLQYITGEASFYGRNFHVEPGVFIPRPETEYLVETAIERFNRLPNAINSHLQLLDLGTGSGCIAVTLGCELPTCFVTAIELSWNSLCVAQENILRYTHSAQVRLIRGSWAKAIRGKFDGIVSNPPYIATAQLDHLPIDVRCEPRLALDGGDDGMRDYAELIKQVPELLKPKGIWITECGEDQAKYLVKNIKKAGWASDISIIKDLTGRARGVIAQR